MEHDFFVGDVAVVVLVAIEGRKDGLVLPGQLNQVVFFLLLVGAVQDYVVLALGSVLVTLHVTDQDELRVL